MTNTWDQFLVFIGIKHEPDCDSDLTYVNDLQAELIEQRHRITEQLTEITGYEYDNRRQNTTISKHS